MYLNIRYILVTLNFLVGPRILKELASKLSNTWVNLTTSLWRGTQDIKIHWCHASGTRTAVRRIWKEWLESCRLLGRLYFFASIISSAVHTLAGTLLPVAEGALGKGVGKVPSPRQGVMRNLRNVIGASRGMDSIGYLALSWGRQVMATQRWLNPFSRWTWGIDEPDGINRTGLQGVIRRWGGPWHQTVSSWSLMRKAAHKRCASSLVSFTQERPGAYPGRRATWKRYGWL